MAGLRRLTRAASAMALVTMAACNRGAPDAPAQAVFGGTYVSNNRISLMPRRIEFNGPRNCIVYTNGVAYAEGAIAPGSRATGPGPGSNAEGLCQPAQGGMEFSSGGSFGGETMYFRTVDADTFSYQRGGQIVYLTRRPSEAASAPGAPPEEPLATLGLTPSNRDAGQVTVTTNPVTVTTENRAIQVPVVTMENRTVQVPR